jgi:hypothetical protein
MTILSNVCIPVPENQMSAVHNNNHILLDHIYWNLFAGVYLLFTCFKLCAYCAWKE